MQRVSRILSALDERLRIDIRSRGHKRLIRLGVHLLYLEDGRKFDRRHQVYRGDNPVCRLHDGFSQVVVPADVFVVEQYLTRASVCAVEVHLNVRSFLDEWRQRKTLTV